MKPFVVTIGHPQYGNGEMEVQVRAKSRLEAARQALSKRGVDKHFYEEPGDDGETVNTLVVGVVDAERPYA
jgi:hypothetical protein